MTTAGPGRISAERFEAARNNSMDHEVPGSDSVRALDESARQLALLNDIARIATQDIELRPMLQRIVDELHRAYGWEFVSCVSVNHVENRFVCEALHSDVPTEVEVGYSRALGSGIVGEVASSGHTIDLDDVRGQDNFIDTLHGTRSELCVPACHQGVVLAVLNVESRRPAAFHGQRALLETVAEQIAGMIAIAKLHRELGRRAELFQTASELSRAALEVDSFEHTLERIAVFIRDRFALELCGIFVAGEDGSLTQRARAGETDLSGFLGKRWTLDRGIVLRAFRTGVAQYVPDVSLDPDYVAGSPRVRCELAVPIRLQGRLLGIINMESADAGSFEGDNRTMLEALAAQVAGAIHLAGSARRMAEVNRLLEQRSLELQSANAQLRHANAALEQLSQRDGLTGVANRRSFDARLQACWQDAAQRRQPLALLLIDVDHFKAYNDSQGHLSGDDALRRVAALLDARLAQRGAGLARYGGEEFAALLPGATGNAAVDVAEQLRVAVTALDIAHPQAPSGRLSVSIGVASHVPGDSAAAGSLVAAADAALYRAKREGRNRVALAV